MTWPIHRLIRWGTVPPSRIAFSFSFPIPECDFLIGRRRFRFGFGCGRRPSKRCERIVVDYGSRWRRRHSKRVLRGLVVHFHLTVRLRSGGLWSRSGGWGWSEGVKALGGAPRRRRWWELLELLLRRRSHVAGVRVALVLGHHHGGVALVIRIARRRRGHW